MADPSAPEAVIVCAECQAALPADAVFCLRCGTRQVQRPPATSVSATPEERTNKPTVLGVHAGADPVRAATAQGMPEAHAAPAVVAPNAPAEPSHAAVPAATPGEVLAVRSVQKTMMGVANDEFKALAAAAGVGPLASPAAPVAPPAAPLAPSSGATFHGVAPIDLPPRTGTTQGGPVAVPPNSGKTMMGVVIAPVIAPQSPVAPPAEPPPPAAPAPHVPPAVMLPPPVSADGAGTIQGFAPAPHVRPRREAPPMIGGAVPGVPPNTSDGATKETRPGAISHRLQGRQSPRSNRSREATERMGDGAEADDDIVIPGLTPQNKRRKSGSSRANGLAYALLAVGVVLLGGAAFWAFRHRTPSRIALAATVHAAEGGLAVGLTIPNAPAGSSVRYGTVQAPLLPDGTVEFIARDLDQRVGVIDLPIELVAGSAVTPYTARIFVGYRVEPDFTHLGDDPAKLRLSFRVPRGAGLWVAEQAIQVIDDRGIAEIPAPAPIRVTAADPSSRERYAIRVRTTDGVEVRGEYELRVPRTALRVDSPSAVSLATGPTQVIRARAPNATRAVVGGQPVPVQNQSITATVNLVRGRNEVDVVVFAPNGAPASSPVVIYRDVTPQAYLGSNPGGVEAILGDNPRAGVHLRLTGVVVQRSVAGADPGVFQIAVEDRRCPQSRCGVLVAPSNAVTVAQGQRVEIVGETAGVRTYATATDARHTVALVTALFVTPR